MEQADSKRKMYYLGRRVVARRAVGTRHQPIPGGRRLGHTDCGFSPSPMATASMQNIVPFPQLRDQAGYVTSGVATIVLCL